MTLDIEDICIDLSRNNKKFDDEIKFYRKNYDKIYMGNYFYESFEELKIDAKLMIDAVYKILKIQFAMQKNKKIEKYRKK
jgi:hypothetical protein